MPNRHQTPDIAFSALADVLAQAAEAPQPRHLFDAAERALDTIIGHKLFTILQVHAGGELERIYTNMEDAYPLQGRKSMGPTPWGQHVIEGRQPYFGPSREDVRWAFYDHELIESLGCGSVINSLVTWDDRLLGVVNMLHEEGHYVADDIQRAAPFAQALVPAFLTIDEGA